MVQWIPNSLARGRNLFSVCKRPIAIILNEKEYLSLAVSGGVKLIRGMKRRRKKKLAQALRKLKKNEKSLTKVRIEKK
jgi:hypothetical protein